MQPQPSQAQGALQEVVGQGSQPLPTAPSTGPIGQLQPSLTDAMTDLNALFNR
jgi:hypothetical protein